MDYKITIQRDSEGYAEGVRDQVLAEVAAEEDEMKRCLSEMAKAEQPNEQPD